MSHTVRIVKNDESLLASARGAIAGLEGWDLAPPQSAEDLLVRTPDPGDIVLLRTGSIQYWENLEDRDKIVAHDTAGLTIEGAKWLVAQQGAMLIGSDTSGLERAPPADEMEALVEQYNTFVPVHNYLLIHQGVHIGELHYLEDLARDKVYEFAYICSTNQIKGTTAGFTLRPIALR